MKAFVIESGELKIKEMEEPKARAGEVLVALKTAGINRRDLGLPKRYGDNPEALIIGSDGAGIVAVHRVSSSGEPNGSLVPLTNRHGTVTSGRWDPPW